MHPGLDIPPGNFTGTCHNPCWEEKCAWEKASPAREKLRREMGRREANQGGYCDSPTYFNQRIWGQRLFWAGSVESLSHGLEGKSWQLSLWLPDNCPLFLTFFPAQSSSIETPSHRETWVMKILPRRKLLFLVWRKWKSKCDLDCTWFSSHGKS